MTNEWYIQIFCAGTNKKTKEMYNIIEQRTLEKKEIGIGFFGVNPYLINNKMTNINFTEDLSNKQKLYRKRMFDYFINTMKIGDIIYLKNGKNILYKAIIDSDYIYDESDYIRISTKDTTYNQIKSGWFWRHRRKIKNIEKISEIKPGYSRMTLYKKNN